MNDLERNIRNAVRDLRRERQAGVKITDQLIADLAREHALNYASDHGIVRQFEYALQKELERDA